MPILTKQQLRAAIDSAFASGQGITAIAARAQFHDWVDSLLDAPSVLAGAGVSVSDGGDGTVEVSAAGAAAAVGLPSYLAAGSSQPSDAVIAANVAGLAASVPFPSLVYLMTPNDLDRSADDLELQINGDVSRVREVLDFRGDPIAARNLDPGALYEILAHASPSQVYRLTEPIPQRRQDWDLVMVYEVRTDVSGFDPDIQDAWLVDATESDTPFIVAPAQPAGATERSGYLWIGAPVDAPTIAIIDRVGSSVLPFETYPPSGLVLNEPDYGGVPYRWVRSKSRWAYSITPGAVFLVTYGDYV